MKDALFIALLFTAAGVALALAFALVLTGCQTVTRIEYFEPTEANAAYSTPRTEKAQGHGPVRSIEGKSGVPDFSDGKSFNFNLNVIGL